MTDSFLQSMTFSRADEFLDACDCDECENVPPSIRNAIHERKRLRIEAGPIKRTQQRTLVGRDGQISLWCMNMPKNAEPLVEFGSSHRIVWVKKLETINGNALKWIGKGIIGSSDEEKSRKKMTEWTEGNVFLVPSNGGKAVGWIYTSDDSNSTKTATNDDHPIGTISAKEKNSHGFAVLCVAKIPLGALDKEEQPSRESNHHWANQLIECCRNGLESYENQSENESDKTPSYYKFSGEASKLLKKAVREAEAMAAKKFAIE